MATTTTTTTAGLSVDRPLLPGDSQKVPKPDGFHRVYQRQVRRGSHDDRLGGRHEPVQYVPEDHYHYVLDQEEDTEEDQAGGEPGRHLPPAAKILDDQDQYEHYVYDCEDRSDVHPEDVKRQFSRLVRLRTLTIYLSFPRFDPQILEIINLLLEIRGEEIYRAIRPFRRAGHDHLVLVQYAQMVLHRLVI
jgi:hypothetical protein